MPNPNVGIWTPLLRVKQGVEIVISSRILELKRGVGLDGRVAREKFPRKTTSVLTESFPRPEYGARWLDYHPWVGKTACKFM